VIGIGRNMHSAAVPGSVDPGDGSCNALLGSLANHAMSRVSSSVEERRDAHNLLSDDEVDAVRKAFEQPTPGVSLHLRKRRSPIREQACWNSARRSSPTPASRSSYQSWASASSSAAGAAISTLRTPISDRDERVFD
jgi:hypothetical protein